MRTLPFAGNWSRGLSVGTASLREPVAFAVDPEIENVHLVWAQKGVYGIDIHYALVDKEAGILVSEQLQSGLFLPRSFRLLVTPQGQVHVLTHAKSNKDGKLGVYHLRVSPEGKLLGSSELITPSGEDVEGYDAILNSDGQISMAWSIDPTTGGGLYFRTIALGNDASGQDEILQINDTGQQPSMILDQSGMLHLLWYYDDPRRSVRDIHYAHFPNAEMTATEGSIIADIKNNDSLNYSSPVIGYDDGHIYVLWQRENVAGLKAGTAQTMVSSFPKGKPEQAVIREIYIPPEADNSAAVSQHQLEYTPLSAEILASPGSPYVIYPAPVSDEAPALPVLLSARTSYRLLEEMHPVMAVLADGVQIGAMQVARSSDFIHFPVGVKDAVGDVYAVWVEFQGGGKYAVFLSTTSPDWKSGVLQLSARDVTSDVSRELAFGALTAVALTPMAVIILLLPFVWIVILALLGRTQELNQGGGRIQFIVAVVIYYVTKTAAFAPVLGSPLLLESTSGALASILVLAMPVLILALAAAGLAVYYRKADPPGLAVGFFIFAIIDIILTLLIYAPAIYE